MRTRTCGTQKTTSIAIAYMRTGTRKTTSDAFMCTWHQKIAKLCIHVYVAAKRPLIDAYMCTWHTN